MGRKVKSLRKRIKKLQHEVNDLKTKLKAAASAQPERKRVTKAATASAVPRKPTKPLAANKAKVAVKPSLKAVTKPSPKAATKAVAKPTIRPTSKSSTSKPAATGTTAKQTQSPKRILPKPASPVAKPPPPTRAVPPKESHDADEEGRESVAEADDLGDEDEGDEDEGDEEGELDEFDPEDIARRGEREGINEEDEDEMA